LQVYDGENKSAYTAFIRPPRCSNENTRKPKNVTALYRVGPDDTTIPAIAFQRGTQITVVEEAAKANLEYPEDGIRMCTYGYSNWTVFSQPNFEGISLCISHSTEMDCSRRSKLALPSVGSTIRGCGLSTETIAKMKVDFAS